MRIYGKLMLGISGLVLGLFLVAGIVFYQLSTVISLVDYSKEAAALVQHWDEIQLNAQALLLQNEAIESLKKKWEASIVGFQEHIEALSADPRLLKLNPDVRELVKNTNNIWELTSSQIETLNKGLGDFIEIVVPKYPGLENAAEGLMTEMQKLEKAGKTEFLDQFRFTTLRNAQKGMMLANDSFKVILRKMDEGVQADVASISRNGLITGSILSLVVLVTAFIFAHFFAVRLSMRARVMEQAMRQVAERDFSNRPKALGADEIGRLSEYLGKTIESLAAFFRSVRDAVENVSTLKEELSSGTAESAAAVNEINKNIESIKNRFVVLDSAIAQSMQALTEIGNYLSNFSNETKDQSASMLQAGTELSNAVESVGSVTRELNERARNAETLKRIVLDGGERVQATNEIIRAIAHEIRSIVEVIELIDQISEQTNILSMNAAIESAHAGAAGKGFAVVAEEIRKLAESTQDNAQRIGAALQSITDKANSALESSETTARAFDSINADVIGFVGALEAIAEKAAKVNTDTMQVASAIKGSIATTKRISDETIEMNERHRAIQDAMENIKAISDETLNGITEIEVGSREILSSVVNVDEISVKTKERMVELESAMAGFKIEDTTDTGVAVKEPPRTIA